MHEYQTELTTADGLLDAFVCHPDEGRPFPAVILYMDAPGIREELRDMARRLATVGYFVMLPNLYYRTGREGHYGFDLARLRVDDEELGKMRAVMRSLSNAGVVADTAAMLDFIRASDAAQAGPVGCVGYCMSGQFVLAAGAAYPDEVAAIASFYGVGIITDKADSPHLQVHKIKGEIYLAFASDDPHVPESVLAELPAVLDAAGVDYRIEIYPDTEHGFAFPQRAAYRKWAGERHWERLFALYERRLRA